MSDDVLADLTRHINSVLPQHRHRAKTSGGEVQRSTFDRTEQLALVPADYCLKGIGALCHVKAATCLRVERSRFGGAHPVRLLCLTGTEADTEFAHDLYNRIDDTIEQAVVQYKQTHQHSTRQQWTEVGNTMAARINIRLKRLAGCGAEQHARLVA